MNKSQQFFTCSKQPQANSNNSVVSRASVSHSRISNGTDLTEGIPNSNPLYTRTLCNSILPEY